MRSNLGSVYQRSQVDRFLELLLTDFLLNSWASPRHVRSGVFHFNSDLTNWTPRTSSVDDVKGIAANPAFCCTVRRVICLRTGHWRYSRTALGSWQTTTERCKTCSRSDGDQSQVHRPQTYGSKPVNCHDTAGHQIVPSVTMAASFQATLHLVKVLYSLQARDGSGK